MEIPYFFHNSPLGLLQSLAKTWIFSIFLIKNISNHFQINFLFKNMKIGEEILSLGWTILLNIEKFYYVKIGHNFASSRVEKSRSFYLLHNVKSTVKISSIFLAFLENMNFNTWEVFFILLIWIEDPKLILVCCSIIWS